MKRPTLPMPDGSAISLSRWRQLALAGDARELSGTQRHYETPLPCLRRPGASSSVSPSPVGTGPPSAARKRGNRVIRSAAAVPKEIGPGNEYQGREVGEVLAIKTRRGARGRRVLSNVLKTKTGGDRLSAASLFGSAIWEKSNKVNRVLEPSPPPLPWPDQLSPLFHLQVCHMPRLHPSWQPWHFDPRCSPRPDASRRNESANASSSALRPRGPPCL
jgi:hypothetical protein